MKIPKQAKKIFTGVIFDTYQWEQKLYNNSLTTFEMIKRQNTVLVIATKGEKIIVACEEQPLKKSPHTLFGGRQEEGETPLKSAKREFLEESGMVSGDWEILHSYQPLIKIDWTIFYFIARDCKKIQDQKLDPGEKIKLVELTFEQFVKVMTEDITHSHWLAFYLLKLQTEGKLEEFRKKLFSKALSQ